MKKSISAKLSLFLFFAARFWLSEPGFGATLTVNTTNDIGTGSLRQAIQDAVSGDAINFSITGTIRLTNGELQITRNLIIAGPGATNLAIDANHASRVFSITSNATVSISDLTVGGGHAADAFSNGAEGGGGGGIHNAGELVLNGCAVSGNIAGAGAFGGGLGGNGGGIYNAGTLFLNACTVNRNTAGNGGFAPFGDFFPGGAGGGGGGIYNSNVLKMTNCTITGNAGGGGGHGGGQFIGGPGGRGGDGGAIYNAATLALTACTLSSNVTGTGGDGGSGMNGSSGTGGAGGDGGGIFNSANGSSANLRSSIVAGDTLGAGGAPGGGIGDGPDLAGSFSSQGHNLVGRADGATGFTNGVKADLVGSSATPVDPRLTPLANNGGPTLTMALLPDSPAINQGDDCILIIPFGVTTEQRGLARKSGANVDIGAFEFQALMLTGIRKRGSDIELSPILEVSRNYRIERTDTLTPLNWIVVEDNLPGTGSVVRVIDIGGANGQQRFYRARTLP
jgi:hypothetical protein